MRAFIFPGQGSQAVGMGKALAEAIPIARAVFDEVDEALGSTGQNCDSVAVGDDASEDGGNAPGKN